MYNPRFEKDVFKRDVRNNVKTLFRKEVEEATPQQLFQAVSYAVKEAIIDDWLATQKAFDKQDPKMVYYMSMEFLMGRSLKTTLYNLELVDDVAAILKEFHINLDKIAAAVKTGVSMAGGTPILVPAIGVCDGIAMGHIGMKYSLPSRELIADSVETLAQAHQFDALVLIPNCDKIVPGMVMAAARLNIPSIVVSGGPMLAGHVKGENVSLSYTFESVGARKANLINDEELTDVECHSCPGCGSCSGMYTANSMNCLCEAIGMALPGNGTIPAVHSDRIQLAKHAGMKIMELLEKDIKPRDIINEKSIHNALECERWAAPPIPFCICWQSRMRQAFSWIWRR